MKKENLHWAVRLWWWLAKKSLKPVDLKNIEIVSRDEDEQAMSVLIGKYFADRPH